MKIDSIQVKDWRNFQEASYQLKPGLNFITGQNGCGKTNLLEAISYLSFARSFRKSPDRDLIRNSCSKAYVKGIFTCESEKYSKQVEATLTTSGKQIKVDGKKAKTLSSFVGTVLTMVFEPKSVFLFKDEPSERRKLMDETLSSIDSKYLYSLQRYRKVLRERNQALVTMADDEIVGVLTNELIRVSFPLVQSRLSLIKELGVKGDKYFQQLFGSSSKLRFTYRTNTIVDDDMRPIRGR